MFSVFTSTPLRCARRTPGAFRRPTTESTRDRLATTRFRRLACTVGARRSSRPRVPEVDGPFAAPIDSQPADLGDRRKRGCRMGTARFAATVAAAAFLAGASVALPQATAIATADDSATGSAETSNSTDAGAGHPARRCRACAAVWAAPPVDAPGGRRPHRAQPSGPGRCHRRADPEVRRHRTGRPTSLRPATSSPAAASRGRRQHEAHRQRPGGHRAGHGTGGHRAGHGTDGHRSRRRALVTAVSVLTPAVNRPVTGPSWRGRVRDGLGDGERHVGGRP